MEENNEKTGTEVIISFLDTVKVALRISHDKLDDEIGATIEAAQLEMERAGLDSPDTDHPLIAEAIKTYCKYSFAPDMNIREGFFASWQYQLDCLRKSNLSGADKDV